MSGLFAPEGLLGRALSRFTELLTLSCLWLLCSIPLLTMGASMTALDTMTLRMVRKEEGKIAGGFLQAFRANLKASTWIHLLLSLLGVFLGLYWMAVGILPGAVKPFFRGASLLFWVLWLMEVTFVYAVQARFDNTIWNIMKNAWLMAAGNLPFFLLILLITGLPVWIFFLNIGLFLRLLPAWIFLWPGMCAWLNSFLFHRCFRRYIPDPPEE